jgi:hypothetical protein
MFNGSHLISNSRIALIVCIFSGMRVFSAAADEPQTPPPVSPPAPSPLSVNELISEIRAVTGLGPRQLAVLNLDASEHESLVATLRGFVEQNQSSLSPIAAGLRSARRAQFTADEAAAPAQQGASDAAIQTAKTQLVQASATVIGDIATALPTEKQTLFLRLIQNADLEPALAIIDLTVSQRAALVAAERARQGVTRHHRHRTSTSAIRQAQQQFQQSISAILTAEQAAAYSQARANLRERVREFVQREAALQSTQP